MRISREEIIDIAALEAELDRLPTVVAAHLVVDRAGSPSGVEVAVVPGVRVGRVRLDVQSVVAAETTFELPLEAINVTSCERAVELGEDPNPVEPFGESRDVADGQASRLLGDAEIRRIELLVEAGRKAERRLTEAEEAKVRSVDRSMESAREARWRMAQGQSAVSGLSGR